VVEVSPAAAAGWAPSHHKRKRSQVMSNSSPPLFAAPTFVTVAVLESGVVICGACGMVDAVC